MLALKTPGFQSSVLLLAFLLQMGCGSSRQELQERQEKGRYHYNLAYGHYFDASRPNADAAMQEVLKSLRIHPEYPEAHMLAGLIFLGREMHLQAINGQYVTFLFKDWNHKMLFIRLVPTQT